MTHDEPCSMAPDDKHDLISGTCSHLPWLYQRYSKILNTILIRLVLICNSVIFCRPVIQKNAKNGYHSIKNT
ncbi:hypothetical protein E2K61_22815 [Escherichia coli]|nr:hypothetical protein [Escherichia coli]EFB2444837.1 hypothetical protein [Escherichia coli]KAA0599824.1 hypothetical protein E2K70_25115 [Escherichia coli]KAA0664860.1 hypothetical protein E2K61_22815 [Escherichia coli]